MKTIDFRQGIMAKPIDDNFKEMDSAIREERLNVGGYGISYGLDITIDKLKIHFKPGRIIDREGYSYTIEETELVCRPPSLIKRKETCDVFYDGTIFLKCMPYSENGTSEIDKNKIIVTTDTGIIIDVVSIKGMTLKISRDFAFKQVIVFYSSALKRIDNIVIDNNKLSIVEGISSDSPSIRPEGKGFCIACVLVDPYEKKENDIFYAQLTTIYEQSHLRNVYTDSDNELYLNGIKLSDWGLVYFERPETPKNNMLWFDKQTQKLYVYLSHEWVAIDNQSMTPVSEYKLIKPEECPQDLKIFLFHREDDLNVRFMAGQNELKILIDQYPLFRDQFQEITYQMALEDEELRHLLPLFGYSYEENFNASYENMGIGFRLLEPLKTPSYIQVEVVHRVVDANLHSLHQRSASFVHTGFVDLNAEQTSFTTSVPYRYNENQIQVLTASKNLFEHFDYEEVGTVRSELTNKVELTRAFGYPQRIHYRIITNVYSYDHITSLLEDYISATKAQKEEE